MTKGITIIATRSPIYGNMAYNLCMSIKATGTKIPVCLIHDERAVSQLAGPQLFDTMISTTLNWNEVRFQIDQLSPYDYTMQLDADMLWLMKKPDDLFRKFNNKNFVCTNEGYYDIENNIESLTGNYMWLGDLQESISAYNLKGKVYQMRWEFLMFKKKKKFSDLLAAARDICESPRMKTFMFEGKPVDEFAFYVAANQLGVDPGEDQFLPAYWGRKPYSIWDLKERYYAISFGGNTATDHFTKMYNMIMASSAFKMGLEYKYKLRSKRDYIPERKLV